MVPKSWINGKYLRWRWQGEWDYTEYPPYQWSVRIYDNTYLRSTDDDFPIQLDPVIKGEGLLQQYNRSANYTFGPETMEFQVNVNSANSNLITIFLQLMDGWAEAWMWGTWDFIEVNQGSGGSNNIARIDFDTFVVMEQQGTTGDYGLIRKYVNPEPTNGAWGEEEGEIGGGGGGSGPRTALMWGTTQQMSDAEIRASGDVCGALAYSFSHTDEGYGYGYVWNYYGPYTQQTQVYICTSYVEESELYDFATVFYKGHTFHEPLDNHEHYYVMDNDGNGDYDRILDRGIGEEISVGKHNFVFMWTCMLSDVQGGYGDGHWWGMSASRFHRSDLSWSGYTDPDSTGKCFISFVNTSKPFAEPTNYMSFTYADFASKFYYYAVLKGYTVNYALRQASYDCLGDGLRYTSLYTGYWVYMQEHWWNCSMHVFGDGGMELT